VEELKTRRIFGEDQKLGRDECSLEGTVWSGKPSVDHEKSVVVSQEC
jgi:hypothetical protein